MVYAERSGRNSISFYRILEDDPAEDTHICLAEVDMYMSDEGEELRILVTRYEEDPTVVVTVV